MICNGYLSHDWTTVDAFVPEATCAGCGVDAQDDEALEDCPLRARAGAVHWLGSRPSWRGA